MNQGKISLRKIRPSDVESIFNWENDPVNWEVSETSSPFSREDIQQFVNEPQDIQHKKQLRLMICKAKNEVIGCVDLFEYSAEQQKAGVGILIADQSNRNKGYATKALFELIEYARNELNIVHLFCHVHANNLSSIRLFENCGFNFIEHQTLDGQEVHYYEFNG